MWTELVINLARSHYSGENPVLSATTKYIIICVFAIITAFSRKYGYDVDNVCVIFNCGSSPEKAASILKADDRIRQIPVIDLTAPSFRMTEEQV